MHTRDRLDLALKLAEERHLSVAERSRLPARRMPLSAVVEAVESVLAESRFFPAQARPEELGDGAVIERLGPHSFVVHERFEIGILRFSPIRSRRHVFLRGAVLRYLRHFGPLVIDGVPIDRFA